MLHFLVVLGLLCPSHFCKCIWHMSRPLKGLQMVLKEPEGSWKGPKALKGPQGVHTSVKWLNMLTYVIHSLQMGKALDSGLVLLNWLSILEINHFKSKFGPFAAPAITSFHKTLKRTYYHKALMALFDYSSMRILCHWMHDKPVRLSSLSILSLIIWYHPFICCVVVDSVVIEFPKKKGTLFCF